MSVLLIFVVRLYQRGVSPLIHCLCGPGCGCRFEPCCSDYFIEAVRTHGAGRGSVLGLRRILRCQPWGGCGYDPVPSGVLNR